MRLYGCLVLGSALATACITLPPALEDTTSGAGGTGGAGSGGDVDAQGGAGQGGAGEGGSSHTAAGGRGGAGGGGGATNDIPLPVCDGVLTECAAVDDVAVGGRHTCLLTDDARVRCWGSNFDAQLGDAALPTAPHIPPTVVPNLSNVTRVTAGTSHTCALVNGQVFCWGANNLGQLGSTEAALSSEVPVLVPLSAPVSRVVALRDTTCAVSGTRDVWCWGRLHNGQDWNENAFDATPAKVLGLEDMTDVSHVVVGGDFACARDAAGQDVRCWGHNASGELGDGTLISRTTAASVQGLDTPVVRLAAGASTTCTLAGSPQRVLCWGVVLDTATTAPIELSGTAGTSYDDVHAGWKSICLRGTSGAVSCLGYGYYGELGPDGGNGLLRSTPVAVLPEAATLWGGWQHNCAHVADGVHCWGRNQFGQVAPGNGTEEVDTPTIVSFDVD